MLKKALLFLFFFWNAASYAAELSPEQKEIKKLSHIDKISTQVEPKKLPSPYRYLLTQPLMTLGIKKHYGRTPIIQILYANKEKDKNHYSRAILMLLDKNKKRDNAKLAQKNQEAQIVELAFITINFKALPKDLSTQIQHSQVPFGALIADHHIKVETLGRRYFSTSCTSQLAALIHCDLNKLIYGRTHTLIRRDNKKWLARVLELLP